ncbi:ATP-binding sensor histidine kinase [Acaryochloris sp. IP29b_bin.137]|uniref:ATP-binding sensor histidine kinase n=1 Tax=Acaryochloris sp. IP29b_bin.137 TaxID=2969217 RepID=UPI002602740F|nr:ATP-binding sensor histidine kinase [Acaryochloris sp. IP29b_bin.137]
MFEIANHETQTLLYRKDNTSIYIIKNIVSNQKFVAKSLSSEYPSFSNISKLRYEYELTRKINTNGIIKAYSFIANNNIYAYLKEYFEGITLKEYISKEKLKIDDFLKVACQLTKAICEIHDLNIIHKDINPSNIIYNPKTNEVKITDFSIASENAKEKVNIENEEIIEGTPLYLSPEQTGRIDRDLDYRTDLYSLGITFYELLTGRVPFQSHKISEVIHMHLSVTPIAPHNIVENIPKQISEIVMRLIQKNAEDRYQNSQELLVDIEQCAKNLSTHNTNFTLKTKKNIGISKFYIPDKVYGRDKEQNILNEGLENIFKGRKQVILISGKAGVGKTSLVKNLNKINMDRCRINISGKFEQNHKNTPYYGFIQGLTTAIKKILKSDENNIQYWQERFTNSLGKNISLLTNVIPELNSILQLEQIEHKQVLLESQTVFIQTLESLVQVFSSKEHPIVFFLDDVQWADFASLELLTSLIMSKQSKYILFILAYRDAEIKKIHPFNKMLSDLRQAGLINNTIQLQPLCLSSAKELIADTLSCDIDEIEFLAKLIFKKSEGNPFFLIQLLITLYQDKYIYFDYNLGKWTWDVENILKSSITDFSILELLSRNIKRLPQKTQDLIKLSSCIGSQFDLFTLAGISYKNDVELYKILLPAVDAGLIVSTQDLYDNSQLFDDENESVDNIRFRFVHDYFQQVIYASIPKATKSSLHISIGELLIKNRNNLVLDKEIFDAVKHFNKGIDQVRDYIKKNEIAELNYLAGNKSKQAAAYESACQYYIQASQLSEKKYVLKHYSQSSIQLHLSLLECLYICSEVKHAEKLAIDLLENSNSFATKVAVYELQIAFYFTQNEPLKSINIAIEALSFLNVNLSEKPYKFEIIFYLLKAKILHRRLAIKDLVNLPIMSNENNLAAMRVLMALVPATFVARPNLFPLVILKMVSLSISYGNSPVSSFAYNSYGTLYNVIFNDVGKCCDYSDLSLQLLDQFSNYELKPAIFLVGYAFNRPWKENLRSLLPHLSNASDYSLEIGDIENLGHCSAFYCTLSFFSGKPLSEIINEDIKYIDIVSSYKQYFDCIHLSIWAQVSENLVTVKSDQVSLNGSFFNEKNQLRDIFDSSNNLLIFSFYLAKLLLSFYYKRFDKALYYAHASKKYIDAVNGFYYVPIFNFYYALTLLSLCCKNSNIVKYKYLLTVKRILHRFKKWSKSCPENFSNKYFLIKAEYSRVLGDKDSASRYYERSIDLSKAYLFLQEEALANELAAEFYLKCNQFKISSLYFKESCYAYFNWGSLTKIEDIQLRYSNLIGDFKYSFYSDEKSRNDVRLSASETLDNIDLRTVIESSQAISEEIIRDKLLQKLLRYLIELAGATQAFLVLCRDRELFIEAHASINNFPIVNVESYSVDENHEIQRNILDYIYRTKDYVLINDSRKDSDNSFGLELYPNFPKSILSMPIISQGKLIGIAYLENNLVYDAFRDDHIETIRILCAQAAISLENAYLYEDLQQSQAREQAEREINELKSRFISMTSHEFRTPLTAILGTTELIKHYGQGWDTEKQHTYLDRIQKNVKHMTGLLDDVLVLSKADVGKTEFNPTPLDLETFCNGLVEEFQLNTKLDQRIECEVHGNHPHSYADEKILRQILSNLLSNAIKYSPEKTTVRFNVSFSENEATFLVQDQGIGIPEADQPHLFESFHRATNVGQIQGTGLGLAIVKKSVELHRGTITFESIADQGTTFIVKLPITAEALGIEAN